jgi:predicted glycogen debranching enzyme
MSDWEGPWPKVEIEGDLAKAESLFLHTNGTGAYVMSTAALMHTSHYHGLLVAALAPPVGRYVILSHLDTVVAFDQRLYRLGTYQFPNVAPTPGYRYLRTFHQDPFPRFSYKLGKRRLEVRLCLVRGKNALIVSYTYKGRTPARISAKPLLALRPLHELSREHGGMVQRVRLRQGAVELQPVNSLPPITIQHGGVFMGSPDWGRRFEYQRDRERGLDSEEDLWSPGTIEFDIEPGVPRHVVISLGDPPEQTPEECIEEAREKLLARDLGEQYSKTVRSLAVAAGAFRADAIENAGSLSGFPSPGFVTRDTLASLPGLFLVSGRLDGAKRVVSSLLDSAVDGLLSGGKDESNGEPMAADPSTSLWLFDTARALLEHLEVRDPFVQDTLFTGLVNLFERIMRPDKDAIWLSESGLVVLGPNANAPGATVTPPPPGAREGRERVYPDLFYGRAGILITNFGGA